MRSPSHEGGRRAPGVTIVTLDGASAGRGSLPLVPVLQAVLLVLVVANLGRVPAVATGGREFPVLVNDLAVGVLITLASIAFAQQRRLELDRPAVLGALFVAVGAVSTLLAIPRFGLSASQAAVSLAYLARWVVYFAVYVIVVNVVRAADANRVWAALETAILLFASFGVVQAVFMPDFALMIYPDARAYLDWDPQGHRLVSTFLDPNYAGAFILIGLVVALAQQAMGARVAPWKLVLLLAALFMTASRSSVLAFVCAGAVLMAARGLSKHMVRAAGAGAVIVGAALPWLLEWARAYNKLEIDASALTRVMNWIHGLTIVGDHPVLGIGFNTWGFVQERYGWAVAGQHHAASFGIAGGLLFVAALTGLVGLGLYVGMLVAIIRRARAIWRDGARSPEHRGLALGGAALVPMIVVHSLFVNSLFYPFLMEALWVVWGLGFAVLRDDPQMERHAESPTSTGVPRPRVAAVALGAGPR